MTTPFEVEEAVRREAIAAGQCAHCMTRYPMADSERIYIETSGTNCQVGGHQCRVMSVHHASPMTAIVTAWPRTADITPAQALELAAHLTTWANRQEDR